MRLELDISGEGWRLVAARTDALGEAGLERVSDWRRAKVLSYRFEKDRRLSLLAGLLLDELLRDRGLCERDMRYVEGEHGKPAFADHPDLHFSLAHSGEVAVAALSDRPIGVDVERLPDFPRDIADPHEWTTMESVAKLVGCGMAPFLDSVVFTIPEGTQIGHRLLDDHLVALARECGS